MAQLSSLLGKRKELFTRVEENLEQGAVYLYQPGLMLAAYRCQFCWKPPATGQAVIEVWGPAGSGGMMCCCGIGLPGNPGAYSVKCICVTTSQYVCGNIGLSCGNASNLCFRGCSAGTGLCWFSTTTNGCMCAEGGRGGDIRCNSGSFSTFCCFQADGYCVTPFGSPGCGVVCNRRSGDFIANAYGGDINQPGGFSCLYIGHCNPACVCSHKFYLATSPGRFTQNGAVATVSMGCGGCISQYPGGQYLGSMYSALSMLSKSPSVGVPYFANYASSSSCGCYEMNGCIPFVSTGIPGLSGMPCDNVRDHGIRGGHGAVRIRFIQS